MLKKEPRRQGIAEFEHWDAALHLSVFRATKNQLLIDYCEAINTGPPPAALASPEAEEPDRREARPVRPGAQRAGRCPEAARPREGAPLIHQHLIRVRDSLLAIEA